jgi:NTP pyrophosphatase (non-canonical NTP hydrolase)
MASIQRVYEAFTPEGRPHITAFAIERHNDGSISVSDPSKSEANPENPVDALFKNVVGELQKALQGASAGIKHEKDMVSALLQNIIEQEAAKIKPSPEPENPTPDAAKPSELSGAEKAFSISFKELSNRACNQACTTGWHDSDPDLPRALLLLNTEIAEAAEALRDGNPRDKACPAFSRLEVELADLVIRLMDTSATHDLDIPGAIAAKMAYNKTRPYKHGGKAF